MTTLAPPAPPVMVMVIPGRCPEYWRLAATLHRVDADNTLEEHVGKAGYREIALKIELHFKNCPTCRAWWEHVTSREPEIILEGDNE